MFSTFEEKAIASNAAHKATENLFAEYDKNTGTKLFISSNFEGKVIFEGERDKPDSWPTKKFKNSFDSFSEIHEYFKAST